MIEIMCQQEVPASLTLEGSCEMCGLGKNKSSWQISGNDLIPKKFCFSAFFVLVPYWLSMKQGGWFRWRENKEDVTVQCPRPEGVLFLITRHSSPNQGANAQVISMLKPCPRGLEVGFSIELQNNLCPGLIPGIFSSPELAQSGGESMITCVCAGNRFKVRNAPQTGEI
ncbi:MAG: hypothetical protein H7832_10445 [Magnetococcus sp. DMHC-6]